MPQILINEKDYTSPGASGDYANYSVLITGFMDRKPVLLAADGSNKKEADKIQPDANGVYEFTSRQDFEDTIGFSEKEKEQGFADASNGHYGKRMARELLNLGYTVIYQPITAISQMNDENFWAKFKDKASYDFRFISHGLLETSYADADAVSDYEELLAKREAVENDFKKFSEVYTKIMKPLEEIDSSDDELETAWDLAVADYVGFITPEGAEEYSYKDIKADYTVSNVTGTYPALSGILTQIDAADRQNTLTVGVLNSINSHMAKLARYDATLNENIPGRGDCIALIELDKNAYVGSDKPEEAIINAIKGLSANIGQDGKFCAMTVPSVFYTMNDDTVEFPGAFHYLACFMNSLRAGFAEWYAAAGYTRGVSSYAVDHTAVKLGEIAINALEPRVSSVNGPKFACNVIANFRGSYYLWGNRTAHPLDEKGLIASHFLNIRQLCTTIKKQLYVACRRFTFDPNSDTLWFNFVSAIRPTLEAMKADQGIRDYKVIKVYANEKATLKAKIRIIPIEAVEDFDLEISLEDSFGETSAVVSE